MVVSASHIDVCARTHTVGRSAVGLATYGTGRQDKQLLRGGGFILLFYFLVGGGLWVFDRDAIYG